MSETAKRILVVDDDRTMRMLYEDLLSGRGYSVITAENALEALKLVENQSFMVLFFDIKLPGMNGFELCFRVKKEHPATPVYAVTGYADQYDVKHFREAGFDGFVLKPIDVDVLLGIVRRHEPA